LQEEARRDPTPKSSIAIHAVDQRTQKKRKRHSDKDRNSASSEGSTPKAHGAREHSAMALEPKVQKTRESSAISLQQTGQNLTERRVQTCLKGGTKQLMESTAAVVEHHPLTIAESKVESTVQQLVQSKVESGLQQLLESSRVQELLESRVQELAEIRVRALLESRAQELRESRAGSSSVKQLMQSKPSDLEQTEQEFAGKICHGASFPVVAEHSLLNATVYYPSKATEDAVAFDQSDLQCLEPTEWISDKIVDFYIKYIGCRHNPQKENLSKFHFFNTFLYGRLDQVKDDEQVGLRLSRCSCCLSVLQGSKPDPNTWQCAGILQGGWQMGGKKGVHFGESISTSSHRCRRPLEPCHILPSRR
jgi:hypothetical protein